MGTSKNQISEDCITPATLSDADEHELARIGKKSVLRRSFSPLAVLGFACSLMITWEALLSVIVFGLQNGGPAGLIYGFLFVWIGYAAVVATMGELVSMWPTAGGQYHWTYILAEKAGLERWKVLLSYITGWQAVIAWQALTASAAYISATVLQGVITNSQPSYTPERWHGTLLVLAVMLVCLVFNTFFSKGLPHVETLILWLHVLLFIVVLVTMTVKTPQKSSNAEVWTLFLNDGGYDSKGVSFFVGLIAPVFAFAGTDGAVHLAEEIKNPSRVLPWAMLGSIIVNGITGFAMLITILYCIGSIPDALDTPTGFPFIEILTQGTSSIAGGSALCAGIVVMFISATLSVLASSSRQLWAFARDNAVPNARLIAYVHPRMKIPLISIGLTTLITCLLSLINIGSATAFNAIVSLTVAGLLGSYLIPFTLLLYLRITAPKCLVPGPWSLGRWGMVVNAFAIGWSVLVLLFSFWPQTVPVTLINMNWSCVLWGGVVVFAGVFWVAHGRKTFQGPVVEVRVDGGGAV